MIRRHSPGREAVRVLMGDRFAVVGILVIASYAFVALLSAFHLLPWDYAARVGPSYVAPNPTYWLGTDLLGRNVWAKVLHGAEVAFSVGLVASVIAIPIGAVLGALAGYFGGRWDELVVWLYSTVESIPSILLLTSLSFVLGRGLTAIYVAVGLTSWVGICRLIRSETLKLKERDYVVAARAMGARHRRLLFRHIFPNVTHLLIIDFSLRFIYAIKSEAILSYLGLGVQGEPSWGIMIADAKEELLRGIWWQLVAATGAMFFIVLALNIVGDSLRDALDPRLHEQA
ncbi:MAG TPA: ABC transporter permease [Bdellovibrionota bacterium]|nr:ABC transporter permease [Bdellovibrionota bacterium]